MCIEDRLINKKIDRFIDVSSCQCYSPLSLAHHLSSYSTRNPLDLHKNVHRKKQSFLKTLIKTRQSKPR